MAQSSAELVETCVGRKGPERLGQPLLYFRVQRDQPTAGLNGCYCLVNEW